MTNLKFKPGFLQLFPQWVFTSMGLFVDPYNGWREVSKHASLQDCCEDSLRQHIKLLIHDRLLSGIPTLSPCGLKSDYWFLCRPKSDYRPLTVGLPQPGTPPFSGWSVTQRICQQGLTSCLDQISPSTFHLIFTSPLRVTKTSVWQHWAPQSKPAFSRSQGLQQKEQN